MKIKISAIIIVFLVFAAAYYFEDSRNILSQIKSKMAFKGKEEAQAKLNAFAKTGLNGPASSSIQLVSSHADQEREPFSDPNQGLNKDFFPDLFIPIGGFVIKFHHWPSEEEGKQIIQYMKTKGLEKAGQLSFNEKTWGFSWEEGEEEVKDLFDHSSVCSDLPKLPSVHSCSPSLMSIPASSPQGLMFGRSQALDNCGIVKKHKHNEALFFF